MSGNPNACAVTVMMPGDPDLVGAGDGAGRLGGGRTMVVKPAAKTTAVRRARTVLRTVFPP